MHRQSRFAVRCLRKSWSAKRARPSCARFASPSRCGLTDAWTNRPTARSASISDFIQSVPKEGAPASERTDAWVLFDDNFMYVSCRCWDSAPPEQWTANEMRRDTSASCGRTTCSACCSTPSTIAGTATTSTPTRSARSPIRRSPTKATRTWTGTRSGRCGPDGSRAAGPPSWRFRSSRCATSPAPTRPGGFSCAAASAARTSSPT